MNGVKFSPAWFSEEKINQLEQRLPFLLVKKLICHSVIAKSG